MCHLLSSVKLLNKNFSFYLIFVLLLCASVTLPLYAADPGTIATVAGGGLGDGGPATQANLQGPTSVAVDSAGNLYIAEGNGVRKVIPSGQITTLLGRGSGLAVDNKGNLFVADAGHGRVRKVTPSGLAVTVAGGGIFGKSVENGPANEAWLASPVALGFDSSGDLFIVDRDYQVVRKVSPDGLITTVAGSGPNYNHSPYIPPPPIGDGGPATKAVLYNPEGLALDAAGNLYIADTFNHRVRKVDAQGMISTVAGTGQSGYSGDGGPANQAQVSFPQSLAFDSAGNLYIADSNTIRKIDSHQIISTVAGNDTLGTAEDGSPALGSPLNRPFGITFDSADNLFIAESGSHRIRRIGKDGLLTTVAGSGPPPADIPEIPDGVRATSSLAASGLSVDESGNLYISERLYNRVRKIDANGIISTFAGTGEPGHEGDNGPALQAQMELPTRSLFDSGGNLLVSDEHWLRKITPEGFISTVLNFNRTPVVARDLHDNLYFANYLYQGLFRFGIDGKLTSIDSVLYPFDAAADANDDLFVLDSNGITEVLPNGSTQILKGRVVQPDGTIDPGPPKPFSFSGMQYIALDSAGNIFVALTNINQIQKISPEGIVTMVAGELHPYSSPGSQATGNFSGDGGPAALAELNGPRDLKIDDKGNLYFNDSGNHRIRVIYGIAASGVLPAVQPPSLQMNPVSVGLQGGETQRFTVNPEVSVQWSLSGSGTLDADGAYHAPATVSENETVTITAFAKDNSWRRGTAVVNLLTSLILSPSDSALKAGQTQKFAVTPPGTDVTWTVGGGDENGTFDADGTYHAPASIAADHTVAITATPKSDGRAPASVNLLLLASSAEELSRQVVTVVAGGGSIFTHNEGKPALQVTLTPTALALNNGLLYFSTSDRIQRINANGTLATAAGGASPPNPFLPGGIGDGGTATQAFLNDPHGVAFSADGSMFVADSRNHRIRKIMPDGTIQTIAGIGPDGSYNGGIGSAQPVGSYSGDGGPAKDAGLNSPTGLAADSHGNLYIADTNNHRIRKIDPNGTITTVAGVGPFTGTGSSSNIGIFSGDGGPAIQANLSFPTDVAVDTQDNLYISDTSNHLVRKVTPDGVIVTVAGVAPDLNHPPFNPNNGFSGDGGPSTQAEMDHPNGIAVDGAGNLYIADTGNNRIRKVSQSGTMTTVAGGGTHLNDDVPATDFLLRNPQDVIVDGSGDLLIADTDGNRVLRVTTDGRIHFVAGTGLLWANGDGGPARDGLFLNSGPQGIALDRWGNLFVTGGQQVRQVDPAGIISTLAGVGWIQTPDERLIGGLSGDGGPGLFAALNYPGGVTVDDQRNVYFVDQNNNRVRKIDLQGIITTFAGGGTPPAGDGDGGPAAEAFLSDPDDVALDAQGNLYITEWVAVGNSRIRRVSRDGIITTVAGGGTQDADNVPATDGVLQFAQGITFDIKGNMYFSDGLPNGSTSGPKVRKVDTHGILTTVAGGGTGRDGDLAVQAALQYPHDVAVDALGNLFIADGDQVRMVGVDGRISTVAGLDSTKSRHIIQDGEPAWSATFNTLNSLAIDSEGNVLVADLDRVYKISSLAAPGLLNGQPFPVPSAPGDITGDGQINAADVMMALKFYLNLESPTTDQLDAADVWPKPGTTGKLQGDGKISGEDLNWIFRRFLGLE